MCRECKRARTEHIEQYQDVEIDGPESEEIESVILNLCVSSLNPYAYVFENKDKRGRKCKPHWHVWVLGYNCEIRKMIREVAQGHFKCTRAITQSSDDETAHNLVNYYAKNDPELERAVFEGFSTEVIENGLKKSRVYREKQNHYVNLIQLVNETFPVTEDSMGDIFNGRTERSLYKLTFRYFREIDCGATDLMIISYTQKMWNKFLSSDECEARIWNKMNRFN